MGDGVQRLRGGGGLRDLMPGRGLRGLNDKSSVDFWGSVARGVESGRGVTGRGSFFQDKIKDSLVKRILRYWLSILNAVRELPV